MNTQQYAELRSKYWAHRGDYSENSPIFIITKGRNKGTKARVKSAYHPKLLLMSEETGEDITIHYAEVEYTDANGEPALQPVKDMTGRPMEAGKWVVYSVGAGGTSHALEIGRISEITRVGALKVERTIQNGEKVGGANTWRDRSMRIVNDPDRSLMLPVEVSTLTMWVMTEFENLKDDE